MTPPRPAAPPVKVKVTTLIRFTRTPARRAASALPPEATMLRPNVVRPKSRARITMKTRVIHTALGIVRNCALANL